MPDQKMFDLHIEVGISTSGVHYAKTILGHNGILYREEDVFIPSCVGMLAMAMQNDGMIHQLIAHPQLCGYPLGSAPSVVTQTNKAPVNPNAKKQRATDIFNVAHPDCQSICISFDNFGVSKCKSICGHRKGI